VSDTIFTESPLMCTHQESINPASLTSRYKHAPGGQRLASGTMCSLGGSVVKHYF